MSRRRSRCRAATVLVFSFSSGSSSSAMLAGSGSGSSSGIPLLRDERTKARLLFGDAPFRGTDLLAERVAHADRGAAALLHRRRLEARFLGALRSGVVRIDGYLLAALGCRKDIGGGISRRRSDLAVARQLFATREELGTLALDRDRKASCRAGG